MSSKRRDLRPEERELWRRVTKERLGIWHQFRDLSMFEWSKIMFDKFDLQEIYRLQREAGLLQPIEYADEVPDDPSLDLVRTFLMQLIVVQERFDRRQRFAVQCCS